MRKKLFVAALAVVLAAVVAVIVSVYLKYTGDSLPDQYYNHKNSPTAHVPKLDHVVLIVMENHSLNGIIGSQSAPYLNELADKYALAENYYSTAHPSLPNYIQLTSGTNAGISSDCSPPRPGCQADVKNIADLIEAAGRNWKEYAQGMPEACATTNHGRYAVKHNPFVYYPDISNNAARCRSHVVPLSQLADDLSANNLPDYSFITPDMCNDMHDCLVPTGDQWLSGIVPEIINSTAFSKNSLLVITWDEGAGLSNHIPTILAGSAIKRSYVSKKYYSHYSLLRTIEKSWGLPALTANDRSAPIMDEFFK